jgi:hypothetical protein
MVGIVLVAGPESRGSGERAKDASAGVAEGVPLIRRKVVPGGTSKEREAPAEPDQ